MPRQQFKGISNRGRYLLAIPEGREVDFKEALDGLHAEDLVAFANSESGGAVLIGVREGVNEDGTQTAEVVGSVIGDEAKLSILNKAASCHPPIELEIFFENIGEEPFIRLEIGSSRNKPHCTASGTYKIREDGRNMGLHPRALLGLFVERESERFLKRFDLFTVEAEAGVIIENIPVFPQAPFYRVILGDARLAVVEMGYTRVNRSDSGHTTTKVRQTAVVLDDGQLDLPLFNLSPTLKGVTGFLMSFAGDMGDINFQDSPDFSQQYHLHAWNETAARVLFTPALREFFSQNVGWSVRGNKGEGRPLQPEE